MTGSVISYGDIEFNYNTLDLCGNGKEFHLTLKESQILELLLENKGRVITKSSIIEKLWGGWDTEAVDTHVHVQIAFLRKKIEIDFIHR